MNIKDEMIYSAKCLYDFCEYPAVKYRLYHTILKHNKKYVLSEEEEKKLYQDFIKSDIVEELYQTQDDEGAWGPLFSKDYTMRAKIPTTMTGVERCIYIGLTVDDRDMLFMAKDYLEMIVEGRDRKATAGWKGRGKFWGLSGTSDLLEAIETYNPINDDFYQKWKFIAEKTFEDGTYSYEREKNAQHEIFDFKDNRLIPMFYTMLIKRRSEITPEFEDILLHTYGQKAYDEGFFWRESPKQLPDTFCQPKMNRWFRTLNHINLFKGTTEYLQNAAEWLLEQRGDNGIWDWGSQIRDPWGYFNYFSCNRHYSYNRIVNGSMEVLLFLAKYIENNNL